MGANSLLLTMEPQPEHSKIRERSSISRSSLAKLLILFDPTVITLLALRKSPAVRSRIHSPTQSGLPHQQPLWGADS
jgi:hypothetical protein